MWRKVSSETAKTGPSSTKFLQGTTHVI